MGFTGFQQLRFLLVRDLGAAAGAAAEEPMGDPLSAVPQRVTRGLQTAFTAVDREQFEAATVLLAAAPRIVIVANGASGPVAQHFRNRLIALGTPCEAPGDAVIQQVLVRQLGERDVVVAISDSGMNSVTLNVVDSARAGKAALVGVTSYARSDLSGLVDVTLVLGASEGIQSEYATHVIAQMALLNALEIAVVQHRGGDAEMRRAVHDEVFGKIVRRA